MHATIPLAAEEIKHPINLTSRAFAENKVAYYKWLRENAPVYKGKISVISLYLVSRYQDCVDLLKDDRFVRNRSTATGGKRRSPIPIPIPKSVLLIMNSMITEDGVDHRRLRNLVHQAFVPRRLRELSGRIQQITEELLDAAGDKNEVDLIPAYSHPIPVTVIAEMLGVEKEEVPRLASYVNNLTDGFSGWRMLRTIFWDLRSSVNYARELIRRKRDNPQDDILTGLIEAREEDGDRLSEDELVAMVFLLIIAGHETTVHLITNAVQTLLTHPDQLERLKQQPALMESAVEEILRYNGPIHGTKPNYPCEDVTLHDVAIPKGSMVMPLLGAANFDETVFDRPEEFDIGRSPNRQLGFGQGIHYCLGAPLARIETSIALRTLLDRYPNLRLAVAPEDLELQLMPGWHRYKSLPVVLK